MKLQRAVLPLEEIRWAMDAQVPYSARLLLLGLLLLSNEEHVVRATLSDICAAADIEFSTLKRSLRLLESMGVINRSHVDSSRHKREITMEVVIAVPPPSVLMSRYLGIREPRAGVCDQSAVVGA